MIVEDLITNKTSLLLCKLENQVVILLHIEKHQASYDICSSLKSNRKFIIHLNFVGIYNMIH